MRPSAGFGLFSPPAIPLLTWRHAGGRPASVPGSPPGSSMSPRLPWLEQLGKYDEGFEDRQSMIPARDRAQTAVDGTAPGSVTLEGLL